MKSQIDWNEIIPKLGEGLQQTLYLEAVRLITSGAQGRANGTAPASGESALERKRRWAREWYRANRGKFKAARRRSYADSKRVYDNSKRNYAAEYARRIETGSQTRKTTRRKFTPAMKQEILSYYKEHGHRATADKFRISGSMIRRWRAGKLTPTEAKDTK
jgi:hypothetical protein